MSTIAERIEAVEADGYPVCPGCQQLMDRTHPGTPLRDGKWTPRTCPRCERSWRVLVRDEGTTRRVIGYEQRTDEPGLAVGRMEDPMSTKSKIQDPTSKKSGADESKQPTPAPKGREHAIAQGVKAMKTTRTPAAAQDEAPMEILIDATGVHSLKPKAAPAEAAKLAKTKTPPAAKPQPTETGGTPEQPDDSTDLVVFAFRLTRAERDLIHGAAGSAKASKFVRNLAVAGARGNIDAVQQLLTEVHLTGR